MRTIDPWKTKKCVPTILERTLAEFSGLLLELLDGTLVNTTALVDKMTGRCGLSGIDVSDDYMRCHREIQQVHHR